MLIQHSLIDVGLLTLKVFDADFSSNRNVCVNYEYVKFKQVHSMYNNNNSSQVKDISNIYNVKVNKNKRCIVYVCNILVLTCLINRRNYLIMRPKYNRNIAVISPFRFTLQIFQFYGSKICNLFQHVHVITQPYPQFVCFLRSIAD